MKLKIIILFLFTSIIICAQTSRKPSLYEHNVRQNYEGKWENPAKPKTKLSSLASIKSAGEFNLLNRVFDEGTDYEIPHLIFVIDRPKKSIYYVNTPLYPYHEDFVRYLLSKPNMSRESINQNYKTDDRQFIFGTLSWLKQEKKYVYEFWEGDLLTTDLLKQANKIITQSFYAPITLKTNSSLHERVATAIGLKHLTQEDIIKGQPYIALNKGKAKGRLRIVESVDDITDISENDILVLKETPISIPPVAGVISERPSTILSHVNILTRGWNVPNVYLKNASTVLKDYGNKYVELDAQQKSYSIKLLSKAPKGNMIATRIIEMPNISVSQLFKLKDITAEHRQYCGAKAANLGEINGRIKDAFVPDGFSIPFAQYYQFASKHGLNKKVRELEKNPDFKNNAQVRKRELEKLRNEIIGWQVNEKTSAAWKKQWQTQLGGKGVFVRSSSNSEDLPNFSGAGLYTTVPNVKTDDDLEKAVKTVWASVFNYEAYEVRRHAGIPQDGIFMSVFIQLAIDSDCSGVMITKDPFDESRNNIIYIAAKRGIGIKVVEGKKIAEQVMYSGQTKSIQRISKSDETVELKLQKDGGVKEVPIKGNNLVLTDERVLSLAKMGNRIADLFGGTTQDVEWAIKDDKVIILQARPYLN